MFRDYGLTSNAWPRAVWRAGMKLRKEACWRVFNVYDGSSMEALDISERTVSIDKVSMLLKRNCFSVAQQSMVYFFPLHPNNEKDSVSETVWLLSVKRHEISKMADMYTAVHHCCGHLMFNFCICVYSYQKTLNMIVTAVKTWNITKFIKNKINICTVHAMKTYGGIRSTAPLIFNLGARLRCVTKITPGWAPEPFWTVWRGGNSSAFVGVRNPDCPASSLAAVLTKLFCLHS